MLSFESAKKLIGTDCAFHLYSIVDSKSTGKSAAAGRKKKKEPEMSFPVQRTYFRICSRNSRILSGLVRYPFAAKGKARSRSDTRLCRDDKDRRVLVKTWRTARMTPAPSVPACSYP